MTSETLENSSTCLLGDEFKLAITSNRKGKYNYFCILCNRKHSGVFYCEFCLADELYKRRKTMAFMRLDLCVQSAVCLIAKSNESAKTARAQARGENTILGVGYSSIGTTTRSLPDCIIYDEINMGDSENGQD